MNVLNRTLARHGKIFIPPVNPCARIPTLDDILEAHERIKPFIHRTPVLTSTTLDTMSGHTLLIKCENFQKVGAFKYRGATNAVQSLSEEAA